MNPFQIHFLLSSHWGRHTEGLFKSEGGGGLWNLRKQSTAHEILSARTREPAEEIPWSPLAALS